MNQKIRLIRTFSVITLIIILIANTIRVVKERNNVFDNTLQGIEESIKGLNLQLSGVESQLSELEIQKKNLNIQKDNLNREKKQREFEKTHLIQFLSGYVEPISDTGTAIDKLERELDLPKLESSKINIAPKVSAAYIKPDPIPSGKKIRHSGFKKDDQRQIMVQNSYKEGGMEQVIVQECENGNRDPLAIGDGGDAYGLCQMNSNYHDIPAEYYIDRGFQIKYCSEKIKGGTKFYGPDRMLYKKVDGKKIPIGVCKNVVVNRFYFE